MNLIDKFMIEKEILLKWAKDNQDTRILDSHIDNSIESYFMPVDEQNNIVSYDGNSLIEFKRKLNDMWEDDSVMSKITLPCAVAIMKYSDDYKEDKGENHVESNVELKDYVYEF